jgi:hypothetical protein
LTTPAVWHVEFGMFPVIRKVHISCPVLAGDAPLSPIRNPQQNPFDSTWISYKVRVPIRVTCRSQIQNQRNKINEIAGNQ